MNDNINQRLCRDCQQPLPDGYVFSRHTDWQECLDALSAKYAPLEAEVAALRARVAELMARLIATGASALPPNATVKKTTVRWYDLNERAEYEVTFTPDEEE